VRFSVERFFSCLKQGDWYKIRDIFFGQNYVQQDIQRALELAAS
jgi:hypothetical protein